MRNINHLFNLCAIAFFCFLFTKCNCCFGKNEIKHNASYYNRGLTSLELEFPSDSNWVLYVKQVKRFQGHCQIGKKGNTIFLFDFPDYLQTDGAFSDLSDNDERRYSIPDSSLVFGGIGFSIRNCGEELDIGDGEPPSFLLNK